MFCIDEAHYVEQHGRSFRKEFVSAVTSIPKLIALMPHPVPRIAMSASFCKDDRDTVTAFLGGDMIPNVIEGSLAWRGGGGYLPLCHFW